MIKRRATFTVFLGLVAVTAAACLPPGENPEPPETPTTVLTAGPFTETEPNNTSATADVIPPAVSPFTISGSQNDGDDPNNGDSDYFRLTATSDGFLTVSCGGPGQPGVTSLTVTNTSTGDSDIVLCSQQGSITVPVSDGDTVLVAVRTLTDATGFPYTLSVTNS
jgi:hypothetical protein